MNSRDAILYGAGNYANEHFESIAGDIDAVCFCDSNPARIGETFHGLPVVDIHNGLKITENIYISTDPGNATFLEIQDDLINRYGIRQQQIINFVPYYHGIGCQFIDSYLRTLNSYFQLCCSDFGRNTSPYNDFENTPEKSVELYKNFRANLIDMLNNNKPCACTDCKELKVGFWHKNPILKDIHFGFGNACNMRCSYCKTPNVNEKFEYGRLSFLFDFLGGLRRENIVSQNTRIHLASGEITVNPHCNEILNALSEYHCVVFSNGLKYNEVLSNMLSAGNAEIICSIDAGTQRTFRQIKGCDAFHRVCENLFRYQKTGGGGIVLKYIFLPDINDSNDDVRGFVSLAAKISPAYVHISRDANDMTDFPQQTIDGIVLLITELYKLNITVYIPEFIFTGTDYDKVMKAVSNVRGENNAI